MVFIIIINLSAFCYNSSCIIHINKIYIYNQASHFNDGFKIIQMTITRILIKRREKKIQKQQQKVLIHEYISNKKKKMQL